MFETVVNVSCALSLCYNGSVFTAMVEASSRGGRLHQPRQTAKSSHAR